MIARTLLLATALLAASAAAAFGAEPRRRHRSPRAARQRHGVGRSRADRRHHRQCRHGGADRDLPRAGSRHHRLAAGGPGAQHAARASGDRRRHQGSEGDFGDAAGPHASRARTSSAGRPRAGAQERPRRAANLSLTFDRDRRRCQAAMPPTPARMQPARCATTRATAASTSPSKLPTRAARPHQTALHRHRDRDHRGRGAGARCRTQRGAEILRRRGRAPSKAEVGTDAAGRDRAVGMQARRQLRAGQALQDRRSRQARSGAARPERHADLRNRRGSISPCAARRWRTAPKATSSTS